MGFKARRPTEKTSGRKPAEERGHRRAGDERSGGRGSAARGTKTPGKILPLHEVIRRAIIEAVEAHDSLRQAAKALEMPVSSLRDKLDQFGIDIPGRQSRRHRAQPAFTLEES